MAQRVKRLPAMWETWVQPLGQEDPLEKEMATHSSTLAWKTPGTNPLYCYPTYIVLYNSYPTYTVTYLISLFKSPHFFNLMYLL